MENLKCPQCGNPMGEVEMTGYYVIRGFSHIYTFNAMRCDDHQKEHYQTEAQMLQTLDAMNKIKSRVRGKPRQ